MTATRRPGPRKPREPTLVEITCGACGAVIVTVPASSARSFSAGYWFCSDEACVAWRRAVEDEAAGRLLWAS